MKQSSIAAFFMAGVALGLAFFAYTNYIYMLGFPDGFITQVTHQREVT